MNLGMNTDSLRRRLLASLYRRVLDLGESPAGTSLPQPEADKCYLLYLHVPYCVVLCPFCSFHRVEFKQDATQSYFDCLREEIRLVSAAGYRFDELYVGGGSPTVMPDELIKTLQEVQKRHSVSGISVETNPDDLEHGTLKGLRDAGVTRLSVGVQSFDDDLLRQMQRYEKYGSGRQIADRLVATEGIFDTLNVDLIFNFPAQTEASLRRDMDVLIDDIGVDQVSFYPLMTTASTRKKMRTTVGEVDDARERQLYRIIVERMLAAGYERSSAWCFSRRRGMFDEYIVEREEYLGLGSGAFSYLQSQLFLSTFSINHYRQLLRSGRTGTTCRRAMSRRDQLRYYLMMQLFSGRLDKGAAERRFDGAFGSGLRAEFAALRAIGAVRTEADAWVLTESGYYLWVMMMREFFTAVNGLREQMRHRIRDEVAILEAS